MYMTVRNFETPHTRRTFERANGLARPMLTLGDGIQGLPLCSEHVASRYLGNPPSRPPFGKGERRPPLRAACSRQSVHESCTVVYHRRSLLSCAFLVAVLCGGILRGSPAPPNFVIIFLDDSGWADFRPFGRPPYRTPHVEQLAREGCCYHNFYVPQAVCSASRAALMTGCYPGRTRVFGAHPPRARGLDPSFATLGEILKRCGYRTAVFGKWHLGDQPDTRPPQRGFDESCGLMYSNDMWKYHPENPRYWGRWPLQFWENGRVAVQSVTKEHQKYLTKWYTEHAVSFIRRSKDHPFLLYVPHSMPHVPIFCSDRFQGSSGAGLYGDVICELDWSVGQIHKAIKENGLARRTLILLSSDNGPWISYGNHAGKTPFREAKGTSFDGGVRSACIISFPGAIKPGTVSTAAFCSLDIVPTFAKLAGAPLPGNPVDGHDVWDLITGKPEAKNPNRYYPFSTGRTFEGVISGDGKWKFHLRHRYRTLQYAGKDGRPGKYTHKIIEPSLFNMERDPYERTNVLDRYPEVARRLRELAERHRKRFYPTQKPVAAPGPATKS